MNELNTLTPQFTVKILQLNYQPIKLFEAEDSKSFMQLARRRALNKLTSQVLLIMAEMTDLESKNISCSW